MNLVTIFSPEGETFEVSKANARDLTTHVKGWSYNGNVAAATPQPTTPAPTGSLTLGGLPVEPELTAEDKTNAEIVHTETRTAEEAASLISDAAHTGPGKFQENDFADLPEKADVKAYIEKMFPDAAVDGRLTRDKLIAYAIELAGAAPTEEEAK